VAIRANQIKKAGSRQLVNFIKEYNMTFNEWLNEIEGFGLRAERIHNDLVKDRETNGWLDVREWLEAAYDAGYNHGSQIPPSRG
jgi:hypothetical protein